MSAHRLSQLLLAFWSAWFGIVTLTNVTDGLKAAGVLSADWVFASGNYAMLLKVTAIYSVPPAVVAAMFVIVITWEFVATLLFAKTLVGSCCGEANATEVNRSITVAAALFAGFILADELFIAFPTGIEGTHLRILVALLVSWGVMRYAESERVGNPAAK